jgi:hypothetical protein
MTTDELRAKFEAWYAENTFDYPSNPIGSRECGLQWKSYQAAHASRDAEVEALRHNLSASISKVDRLAAILTGIHNLLYPPEMSVGGKKYVFNPPSGEANDWMRELSDRIRDIPHAIDAAMREESK